MQPLGMGKMRTRNTYHPTSRTVILLVTRNREEGAYRTQLKRMSHNEAEKKRIKTINKCVDDIRELLDVVTSFENESVGRESAAQIGQGIHAGSGRDIHQESDERTRSRQCWDVGAGGGDDDQTSARRTRWSSRLHPLRTMPWRTRLWTNPRCSVARRR